MINVIKAPERKSKSQQFGEAFSRLAQGTSEHLFNQHQGEQENKAIERLIGVNLSGIKDQKMRQSLTENILKNRTELAKLGAPPKKTQASQPIDEDQLDKIKGVRKNPDFKEASPSKKYQMMTDNGVSKENAKAETDIYVDEAKIAAKKAEKEAMHEAVLRAETLPIRKEIADKANAARQGIQNKENLMQIIETGNIDDPTIAAIAEALPLKLGMRILSPESVAYKAGLVDDFRDLQTIFPGTIKVKEVDIYEKKIADLYLTDAQKKSVLKGRINALRADVIRGEVAAELEKEGKFYGALTFEEEVNKRAKPQLDALSKQVWDETKSIIDNAENRKNVPLDSNDPDDIQIIDQILNEAGGDYKKAEKLAQKKGYKF